MKSVFGIALGILAAIGGFVDIGDIVFNVAAGATFGYQLLWAVVLGVGGIMTYAEMCGRVAAVSETAVFDAVRERLGFGVGLVALVAGAARQPAHARGRDRRRRDRAPASLGTLLPGAAVLAVLALGLVLWLMPFEWIERIFGYCGLALLVFVVAAFKLNPDWGAVAHGFVPSTGSGNGWVYAYFVVGLAGAAMIPYEVYFYSSGAIEEQWGPKDLGLNRANAVIGYTLGGLLSCALMISAGALLLPQGINAELLGTVALVAQAPIGQVGLILALVGILFAVSGAAIDSAFAGAYSVAQFFGWEWGKYRHNAGAPRFTLAWMVMLVVAFLIVVTGVDPIMVTEISVIFSVVALPLTYIPILLVANDRAYMRSYANGRVANIFGVFYLVVVLVIAVAAIPLLLLSNMGQG